MISVIMGVYNSEKTVERALKSILNGTHTDLEIIVCDDASTDGSAAVVAAVNDSRITLLRNEKNEGLGYCLNRCLELAKGEFVARMDADDVAFCDRLEKQSEFLLSSPEYAFCGSAAFLFWEDKRWGKRAYPEAPVEKDLLRRCPFIHPTLLFRREALDAVGGYDADKKYLRCEDYELYFRLYEKKLYGFNLPDVLLDYSEAPFDTKKHSFATRKNEARVRRIGARRLKAGFGGFIKSFYPILLYFLPKGVYKKLHTKMWTEA